MSSYTPKRPIRDLRLKKCSDLLEALEPDGDACQPDVLYVRRVFTIYVEKKFASGKDYLSVDNSLEQVETSLISLQYPDYGSAIIAVREQYSLPKSKHFLEEPDIYGFPQAKCWDAIYDIPHLPAQMPADSCDLNVRLPVSSLHPSAPSPKRNIWRKLLRRRWQSHSVSSDEGGQA